LPSGNYAWPYGIWQAQAAELYVRCRLAGITPRSSNDCLIAVTAIEFDLPILHRDLDSLESPASSRRSG
jgi:predicted nucleic acid-binding protein